MAEVHGFELIRDEEVAEWKSRARLYRHVKTGAQLLSMENDDENKAFAITFRTPPPDSTGVAHILEHSVLCGSRKYPLKEPFIELVKGSLNTFLNAMTGSAETYYPVASTNERDFYNLVDVYLDSVFFPRLTPQILEQEGWHYELADKEAPLIYKGVVFNEMKGAYQMPNMVLFNWAGRSLFPNHVYGVSSGGDPQEIPNLTFEELSGFHRSYYHPSNAFIWFWGNDNPEERLRVLDEYLSQFDRREIDSSIPVAPAFSEPLRDIQPFPAGANEDSKKAMLSLNWVLTDKIDPQLDLALEILSYILIGTPASPLRKALVDSGLVEQVMGGIRDLRQRSLIIGMKGMDSERAQAVEKLAFDTLRGLAENGIDRDAVDAAVNSHEFRLREMNSGGFPRGLALGFAALSFWLYDADPLAPIRFEQPLARLKARIATGGLFEGMIQRLLLDNPHRSVVLYLPDPDLALVEAQEERERLEAVRDSMTDADIERVIGETRALQERQQTPDSEAALATLPRVALSDLDRDIKRTPTAEIDLAGCSAYYHDLFTNGILYLDFGFDLKTLPQDLLPYAPLFGKALTQMGTESQDFVQLTRHIDSATGGIWHENIISGRQGGQGTLATLFVRSKAKPERVDELLSILSDILTSVKWDNRERFQQMVLEERTMLEASLSDAVAYVQRRLGSRFSEAGWVNERIRGISYFEFIDSLCDRVADDWPSVLNALRRMQAALINRQAMVANITIDQSAAKGIGPLLTEFVASLPEAPLGTLPWKHAEHRGAEGFAIPGQVGSVGKAVSLAGRENVKPGVVAVAAKLLRTTWLWEKVRVEGGAYGGRCSFDPLEGLFTFASYRDPNVLPTLDIYDRAGEFLSGLNTSESELTRTIIGTISDTDPYQLPDARGFSATIRALTGDTDQHRQRRRDQVLCATLAEIRSFGEVLSEVVPEGEVCIVGSEEKLKRASAERPGWMKVTKLL